MYLDWDSFDMKFVKRKDSIDGLPLVRIKLPIISNWLIKFNYAWNILNNQFIIRRNRAALKFHDVEIIIEGSININSQGYPIFRTTDMYADLGKTEFKLANKPQLQKFANEFLKVMNMMTDHALKIFPENMVDRMMGRVFEYAFDDYSKTFMMHNIENYVSFDVDLRMTEEPVVTKKYMDLFFFGQTTVSGFRESTIPDPATQDDLKFNKDRIDDLQVIITDRVINTFLEAADFLGSFQYDTFTPTFWKMFGHDEMKNLTTSSQEVKDLIPELEQKYGENVPVGMVMYPDNPKITFQRSPFEDIKGNIPIRVSILVKTGDEKKPGTLLWDRVLDVTFYTKETFGLYFDKDSQKMNLYLNSMTSDSIKVSSDKIGLHKRIDDFLGSINSMLPVWTDDFDEHFLKPGFDMPLWWPKFLSFNMVILEDALLFQFEDDFN